MIRKIQIGARIILGLIYFIFGSMGLAIVFGFMTMPEQPMPEPAMAFMKGIMGSGYFFPLLKVTEAVCGFFLLINVSAPAALIILAPITLHIFLYHLYLTPGLANLPLPLFMLIVQVIAMSAYDRLYKPLFSK